ncbi:MAG: winged helix-turn-helix transcriptional regulator [Deltaproteobacteria bacterium]|nr:winged helix-turn-helix transcriptional regulator [Deltaproteobacteria bacterium]
MTSLFNGLITSKLRIRILMRLFLNPSRQAYLRELSNEFGVSPSQVREELQQLKESGLLADQRYGRKIHYQANTQHPLFPELHSMVKKAMGMDHIFDSIISRLGSLEKVYLLDEYAEGKDGGLIDLLLVGDIDQANLTDLVAKAERYVERKIRTIILGTHEYVKMWPTFKNRPHLLIWEKGQ